MVVEESNTGVPGAPLLEAFDAAGVRRCTGAPSASAPLWTASHGAVPGDVHRFAATPSLLVVGGLTVIPGNPVILRQHLTTFDLAGVRNCTGTPGQCTALDTAEIGTDHGVDGLAVAFGARRDERQRRTPAGVHSGRTPGMRLRTLALATVVALVATACARGHPGGSAARNNTNPMELGLTPDNVDELQFGWQAEEGMSEPLLTAKYAYVISGRGFLSAYAADGPAGAGARVAAAASCPCAAPRSGQARVPDDAGGLVLSGDRLITVGGGQVLVFAADPAGCPATEDGCLPSWVGQLPPAGVSGSSLAVAEGRIFVALWPNHPPGQGATPIIVRVRRSRAGQLHARDHPAPAQPLFTAEAGGFTVFQLPTLTVANGRLYVPPLGRVVRRNRPHQLHAPVRARTSSASRPRRHQRLREHGVRGAGQRAPGVRRRPAPRRASASSARASPLWTATLSAPATGDTPTVLAGGRVFVSVDGADPAVQVFDAGRHRRLHRHARVCQALWGIRAADGGGRAVGHGLAPLRAGFDLTAFDVTGIRNCSAAHAGAHRWAQVATRPQ